MRAPSAGAAKLLDAGVFLLFALALILPSGYSYGAVLLCLLGLGHLPQLIRGNFSPNPDLTAWAWVVAGMGLVWCMHIVDEQGQLVTTTLGVDRCVKYALTLLVLPTLFALRPGISALRWGCAAGATGAGLMALWQVLVQGLPRAEGYSNAIQFGNLALLLGLWSCVWAQQRSTLIERLACWIGTILGIAASLASGTRGGWLALPVLLLLAIWLGSSDGTPKRVKEPGQRHHRLLVAVLVTVLTCTAAFTLPETRHRTQLALQEWKQSTQPNENSSPIGLRRALWREAWLTGLSAPWIGVGQIGYEQVLREAASRREVPQDVVMLNHAHNEALDLFAKRGLLGVTMLVLFYGIPGLACWRHLRTAARNSKRDHGYDGEAAAGAASDDSEAARAAALCGLITVLGFMIFGTTQVMFAHNNGNLMYLIPLSIWISVAARGVRSSGSSTGTI